MHLPGGVQRGVAQSTGQGIWRPQPNPAGPRRLCPPPSQWKHYEEQPEQSPTSLHLDSALDLRRGSFLRPRYVAAITQPFMPLWGDPLCSQCTEEEGEVGAPARPPSVSGPEHERRPDGLGVGWTLVGTRPCSSPNIPTCTAWGAVDLSAHGLLLNCRSLLCSSFTHEASPESISLHKVLGTLQQPTRIPQERNVKNASVVIATKERWSDSQGRLPGGGDE